MPRTPLAVLTVFNSQAIGGTDGRVAMVLETRELGPVAFEVDQRVIDAIRKLPDQKSVVTEDKVEEKRPEIRFRAMVDHGVGMRGRRLSRQAIIDLAILLPLAAASLSLCYALIIMFPRR